MQGGRAGAARFRPDRIGLVISLVALGGLCLPFATVKPNRILAGVAKTILEALPQTGSILLLAVLFVAITIACLRSPAWLRLGASVLVLLALAGAIGVSGIVLTPSGNPYARVAPAAGFWLLAFAMALLTADALTRLRPGPFGRVAALAATAVVFGFILKSGLWDNLSILKEYAVRADSFWAAAAAHVELALGSLVAAVAFGLPIGILCHRVPKIRDAVLNALNIVQTVPSIALFGLLIAPLGWIAVHVPGAKAIGIQGIGMAPAFVALFLYSLLPVVANTVAGLAAVSPSANDAARGMGMTERERLFQVELPLALPVIITGIRIVLVQNIGLATIAALIGGGGFGVFVFQGIGQTAIDLVLLGTVPTVALAFAAAVILDAVVELLSTPSVRDSAP
ncbi:ABC transporter permease [Acidisoma silvae]|uniref:ABC transporter permease n=1 Tax=Acidisoma silvae TaxID=2802396 RepID=A0A964E062_9PROT|nr:ABC transporter permease [Acidisoma silvae]